MVVNDLCVPDCSDLRRRDVDCPTCNGPPPPPPPTARNPTAIGENFSPSEAPTPVPDTGAIVEDGGDSFDVILVAAIVCLFVLCCSLAVYMSRKDVPCTCNDRADNPTHEQPSTNPDGFGFSSTNTNDGYLEVQESKK